MERGRRLDVAWEEGAPALPGRDRAWVHEAAFGTIRLTGRLDHLLDLHLHRGVASLPPGLLPVLRLGAYQLLYMGGVPDYAAVSQAVSQARALHGSALARVVNGVLRSLVREGGGRERFPSLDEDPLGHLSTWGSHPPWLVERWLARWGPDETAILIEANNQVPPTFFRPTAHDRDEARRLLAEAGIRAQPGPGESGTLELVGGGDAVDEALARVPGIIQDPAAGWVVAWVGRVAGLAVADLCAAPGGKAVALAARGARVVAADLSPRRLARVGETVRRLELPMALVVASAEAPPLAPVDVVLVDAPCTGTGTLRRHPDARWRLAPGDVHTLAGVQDRLLDGAAQAVRPGGLLVYATCTLEPEENEERVQAFLLRHRGFILEEGTAGPAEVRDGSFLRVLPQRTGTDGSFAARLRRQ